MAGFYSARVSTAPPLHRPGLSPPCTERIAAEGLPAELRLLAGTFNEMLDRLEESFAYISQFSADVAHELRTPISNLRQGVTTRKCSECPVQENVARSSRPSCRPSINLSGFS